MPQFSETELTAAVIKSFDETPDPRAKFLLQELVKSLHDYVRRTDLTFAEWEYAIDNHERTHRERGARSGDAARSAIFPIAINGLLGINLSARRFFLRSRLKQCGRNRKLIRGFKRDAAFRKRAYKKPVGP